MQSWLSQMHFTTQSFLVLSLFVKLSWMHRQWSRLIIMRRKAKYSNFSGEMFTCLNTKSQSNFKTKRPTYLSEVVVMEIHLSKLLRRLATDTKITAIASGSMSAGKRVLHLRQKESTQTNLFKSHQPKAGSLQRKIKRSINAALSASFQRECSRKFSKVSPSCKWER